MYLITGNKAECCGCTACQQICTHGSITMQADEDGFIFPVKDLSTCTNCGLCERVCPFAHPHFESPPKHVYATMAKSLEVRTNSSSGGLFYLLASKIIEQGGIVYGAILDAKMQVRHVSAETIDELKPIRGSKYVQSSLGETYREIRSHLRNGRTVYFTGVGCQVAGLKEFLMKPYENLITSDLVCHGVPPQKLFDEHISYLEAEHNGKVIDYKFRNNATWGGCEKVSVLNSSDHTKTYTLPTYDLSPYLYSFMYSMVNRLSCYACPFAKVPRQGDITLADYWGIAKFFPQFDSSKGVSLIVVNTDKGEQMLSAIKDKLILNESNIDDAAKYNGNLVHKTNMPPIRRTVFQTIREKGYPEVARTIFRPSNYYRLLIKERIKSSLGDKNLKMIKAILKKLKIR